MAALKDLVEFQLKNAQELVTVLEAEKVDDHQSNLCRYRIHC